MIFRIYFDTKEEVCRHAELVEDCEGLVTEIARIASSTERFQKEMRTAGEGTSSSAVIYKKDLLNVLKKQTLSTAFKSYFIPKRSPRDDSSY